MNILCVKMCEQYNLNIILFLYTNLNVSFLWSDVYTVRICDMTLREAKSFGSMCWMVFKYVK